MDEEHFSDYNSDKEEILEKEKYVTVRWYAPSIEINNLCLQSLREEKSVVYDDDIVLEPICKDNEDREVVYIT